MGEPGRSSGAGGDAPHSVCQSSVMDGSVAQVQSTVCGTSVRPVPLLAAPWGSRNGRDAVTAWLWWARLTSPPRGGSGSSLRCCTLLWVAIHVLSERRGATHPVRFISQSISTVSGCLLFLVFSGLPRTLPGVSPPGGSPGVDGSQSRSQGAVPRGIPSGPTKMTRYDGIGNTITVTVV